jgi:hypothetical protein
MVAACLAACSDEPEPAAEDGACGTGGVVIQFEAGGPRVEKTLTFGGRTFSHGGGDFDTGAAYYNIFAAQGGPLLYVRVHGNGTGMAGPAPAWLVYRDAPSGPFVVSSDAALGWLVDGNPLEGGTVSATFSASRLGQLPACDAAEPSGLRAEYCLAAAGSGCAAPFLLTDESGEATTLEVEGTGAIGGSYVSLQLEGGGIAVYELTFDTIRDGFVIFGERSPDPFSIYCISGAVELVNKTQIGKATFDEMRRVGAFAEATSVPGTLSGSWCP